MRRGDGATVLSGATIATNSHLQDTSWWVGPGWAGGGWWWCSSDDAEEEDEILKNWNRDFLYSNTEIGILNVKSLNLVVWLYTIGFLFGWGASLQWHSPQMFYHLSYRYYGTVLGRSRKTFLNQMPYSVILLLLLPHAYMYLRSLQKNSTSKCTLTYMTYMYIHAAVCMYYF